MDGFFNILLYSYIFVFGACIGSFMNVVIYRVPRGLSVASGRSICPNCNNKIKAIDLIPIFSYIILRGKCRHCKKKIIPRYLFVEALVGLIAVLIFRNYYSIEKSLLVS